MAVRDDEDDDAHGDDAGDGAGDQDADDRDDADHADHADGEGAEGAAVAAAHPSARQPGADPPIPSRGPAGYPRPRLHRPAFDRGGNREQRDALAEERFDLLGRIALSLCLIGVLGAVLVRILALLEPRTWSTHDVGNTLLGTELVAVFIGLLAHRRTLGRASVVIGVVLAVGAWVFMN